MGGNLKIWRNKGQLVKTEILLTGGTSVKVSAVQEHLVTFHFKICLESFAILS